MQTEMCKGQKEPLVEYLKSKTPNKDSKCSGYMDKVPLLHPDDSESKDSVAVMKELLHYFDKVCHLASILPFDLSAVPMSTSPCALVLRQSLAKLCASKIQYYQVPNLLLVGCDLGNQIPALASEFYFFVMAGKLSLLCCPLLVEGRSRCISSHGPPTPCPFPCSLTGEFHVLMTEGREDTNVVLDNIQERWNLLVDPYSKVRPTDLCEC